MASWGEIAAEINSIRTPDKCDIVRRKKLKALQQKTGRNTIIYAVDFLGPKARLVGNNGLSIDLTDKEGFVDVTRTLEGKSLDVILHSPGGTAEAAESIVDLLRAKFTDIRFIIPNAAKSAATMLAMSGNMILMDDRSELGPTDPQMLLSRDGQIVVAPAHDIKQQFIMAKKEITRNPQNLPSWLPILRQYGPSLLAECDRSLSLSKKLVTKWVKKYMFAKDSRSGTKAARIAGYLTSKVQFQSHARKVGIENLIAKGAKVLDMRTDVTLQTAVWDVYLSMQITFSMTGAYKIFENHKGEALIRALILPQQMTVQMPQPVSPNFPSSPARGAKNSKHS